MRPVCAICARINPILDTRYICDHCMCFYVEIFFLVCLNTFELMSANSSPNICCFPDADYNSKLFVIHINRISLNIFLQSVLD